jgi:hypothetical protein
MPGSVSNNVRRKRRLLRVGPFIIVRRYTYWGGCEHKSAPLSGKRPQASLKPGSLRK